jgi:hypothetical protein
MACYYVSLFIGEGWMSNTSSPSSSQARIGMEPPPAGPKQRINTSFADRKAILLRTQGLSAKRAADQEGLGKSTLKRWRQENRNEHASSAEAITEGERGQYWYRCKDSNLDAFAIIYNKLPVLRM